VSLERAIKHALKNPIKAKGRTIVKRLVSTLSVYYPELGIASLSMCVLLSMYVLRGNSRKVLDTSVTQRKVSLEKMSLRRSLCGFFLRG